LLWQHTKQHRMAWSKTDCVIETWLKERQCLLVVYNEICLMRPFKQLLSEPKALKAFCQILIDYVSAGHFEIFEKIAAAEKNCDESNGSQRNHSEPMDGLDKQLLINILRTTLVALDFSDKHTKAQSFGSLANDLSNLGEKLVDRFQWEDELIRHYLKVTNQAKPLTRAPSI
jgi:regulator of sigma D